MNKRFIVFLPLLLILAVCVLLFAGLRQDPKQIASALIGKPVPEFRQADLLAQNGWLTNQDLPDEPFLINIWGSWCGYCKEEHPFLMELARQNIKIVGLNYRDKAQSAVEMLDKMGNPFTMIISDGRGELALKLGVDGAPETYLADRNGIIRYRFSGAINAQIWQQQLLPELEKWRSVQ